MNRAQSPANVLEAANDSSPISRRILEYYDSPQVLHNQTDAIGYASWGSHDPPAYGRSAKSGGELLSVHPAAELAQHRGGRSAVFVGEAVRLAFREGAKPQGILCGFNGLCLRQGCWAHA